ncbi:MAG: glycosyltransferase family 4 protein [Planctomycetaceae bacterium]
MPTLRICRQQRHKPAVAMTVFNSARRDARVLKEAASLQSAGYDVRILGLADDPADDGVEMTLPTGVRLLRFHPHQGGWGRSEAQPPDAANAGGPLRSTPATLLRRGFGRLLQWPLERLRVHAQMHAWNTRVLRQLAADSPDVVHCHDLTTIKVGAVHRRRSPDCRFVYDSHELTEHQEPFSWWHRRHLLGRQRRSGKWVDAYITVNDSLAAYSRKYHPYFPPAVVVKNATHPPVARVENDGRLHRAVGLSPEKKVLLFQGGFVPGRGLPTLLQAATLLPDDWRLVLMGWGPLETELHELRDALPNGREMVRFIPAASQEELPFWTAGATVGTILYENTCLNHWFCSPNKLWEYANAGVPILASRFPEMESTIARNGTGWLLQMPATARQIAERVRSISADDVAAKKRRCAEFVRRDNWSVYESRLLEMYGTLFGGRAAKPRAA